MLQPGLWLVTLCVSLSVLLYTWKCLLWTFVSFTLGRCVFMWPPHSPPFSWATVPVGELQLFFKAVVDWAAGQPPARPPSVVHFKKSDYLQSVVVVKTKLLQFPTSLNMSDSVASCTLSTSLAAGKWNVSEPQQSNISRTLLLSAWHLQLFLQNTCRITVAYCCHAIEIKTDQYQLLTW